MKKFTNLSRQKTATKKEKGKSLFKNDYIEILEYNNWNVIKEKDLVVAIPFLIEENKFIIRNEYIPTYEYTDGQKYNLTIMSGGIEEGETPEKALFRELEEEVGLIIKNGYEPEKLKPLFISKGHVNKYHPFILPLTEKDYQEIKAKGDGSQAEKLSKSVKVDIKYIDNLEISDVITGYMLMKFKEHLNVEKY